MFRAGIITCSDKGYKKEREDKSGELIKTILEDKGYKLEKKIILPDEREMIKEELIHMADSLKLDLILTTGGTGLSKRDTTPEATMEVCEKMANGISEAIRNYSLQITPRAMLSRGVSGIRGDSLIINLPGSPKAVEESLDYIMDSIYHGLEIMAGSKTDCARK